MTSNYEPIALSRSFPKIAVVCGAETTLGQALLRELLLSSEVDKVHFIARSDPEILSQFRRTYLRKVRAHIVSYDNIDRALASIPEADVAFCCIGTDRHAYETIGRTKFQTINYHAPVKFVARMFEIGVLTVSVLSHPKADASSSSQMSMLRGQLEQYTRNLRREAAEFSPYVTIFKISGMTSNPRKSDVRDVAKAMRIDAMEMSARKPNTASNSRRGRYEEFDFTDVDQILEEARHDHDYNHRNRYWED